MILQEFLACGLLVIGEDDKRLEWLEAASAELAKGFLKNKRKLVNATLVALDNSLPEDEPVFEAAEAIVLTHWKAMRGKYPDRPRQILRAVILAALDKMQEDPNAASVVWLVGGSFLPYARLEKERPIVERLMSKLGDVAEAAAAQSWSMTRSSGEQKLPEWTLKLPAPKKTDNYKKWLQDQFGAAAGSGVDAEGVSTNPHRIIMNQFGQGNQAQWAQYFAEHSAAAIAGAIAGVGNAVAKDLGEVFAQLDKFLKDHGGAMTTAVSEALRRNAESQSAQDRRSALLWWRQTLYSVSKRRSYRGLSSGAIAVLMAFDLHRGMPTYSPQSVEYLLREAVREAAGVPAPIAGEQLFADIQKADSTLGFATLLGPSTSESVGRVCLLAFTREMLAGRVVPAAMHKRIGMLSSQTLSLEEWSVWLFRDLQALRLATEK